MINTLIFLGFVWLYLYGRQREINKFDQTVSIVDFLSNERPNLLEGTKDLYLFFLKNIGFYAMLMYISTFIFEWNVWIISPIMGLVGLISIFPAFIFSAILIIFVMMHIASLFDR